MVLALELYLDHWLIHDAVPVTEARPVLLSAKLPTERSFVVG